MGKHDGTVRIGAGASFADDRITPAVQLAEEGELDFLVFECLAERTIARENLTRQRDSAKGYTPRLVERMEAVLPACVRNDVRIVTNMGAANPVGGAKAITRLARDAGLGPVDCAVVLGDDVVDQLRTMPGLPLMESNEPLESILPRMASANAYLGADILARGIATGARVVISGRVADPSLFLSAAMHHHGWDYDDWSMMAQGTAAGHLAECSSLVSGGYFADPGKKEVPDLARLGFPYLDVAADGRVWISKLAAAGGRVDLLTCKEQLLYEMHDPANYVTPDCVLDITETDLIEAGKDRVEIRGTIGRPRTPTYKVTVGYHDGYIGEGQIGFAGINAAERAKMSAEIVLQRLKDRGFRYEETRVDLIGMSSLHGMGTGRPDPYEVRLRIAVRATDRKSADAVGFETRALTISGPSGTGGGSDPMVREILAVKSVLLPRELVRPQIVMEGAAA